MYLLTKSSLYIFFNISKKLLSSLILDDSAELALASNNFINLIPFFLNNKECKTSSHKDLLNLNL